MRIVIATGIYPPEVGGPAPYAAGVAEELKKMGHEPALALFSDLKVYPSGVRHVLYMFRLLRISKGAAAILAFDTGSTGVPAAVVARLRKLPLLIRIGGDFVWEKYVERSGEQMPLPKFYSSKPRLNLKERVAFFMIRWMLGQAQLAFNTAWLRDIWMKPYRLSPERAHVVENVIGEKIGSTGKDNAVLLYGRKIKIKNIEAFKRAFARAEEHGVRLQLEEGLLPHDKLIERMRRAYAVAIPSLTDVAPNTVIDSILCGKPFILTKYSGYVERFGEFGIVVDPESEESMSRGLERIANESVYNDLAEKISHFDQERTYADVTREYLSIVGL